MIITEPEFNLDETNYENHRIYDIIDDSIKEKMDDLDIVIDIILYDYTNVKNIFEKYGPSKWGHTRSKNILKLYEKVYFSELLSRWVGPFSEKISKEIIDVVNSNVSKGYKPKDIVYYLAFSHGSINFILPTDKKKNLIYQLFPDIPKEKIDNWYLTGVKEAKKRVDLIIKKLSKKYKNE
jgi:hypothetical protein